MLCPRGAGTSSIRLYETIAAGRVPVIIADQWVAPSGPHWEEFSIRWPEHRVRDLPAFLAAIEPDAASMGRLAREAFDRWFAPDVALSLLLDQLDERRRAPDYAEFPAAGIRDGQYRRAGAARLRMGAHSVKGRIGRSLS